MKKKKELLKTAQEAVDAGITIEKFCDSVGVPTRSYFLWKKTSNKIEIKEKREEKPP
ncbi:MAG: hypothetical protein HOP07_18865 [Bacteriovoracaceae bacterium]|nr:hypothetical protein [Bacteriovoracaceae bacterium]